jgi:hypothetical protein
MIAALKRPVPNVWSFRCALRDLNWIVEATNIANPTMLGSREISGLEPMNAVAMSKIAAECLTASSAASRTALLETYGFVTVLANNGTMEECNAQLVDRYSVWRANSLYLSTFGDVKVVAFTYRR